MPFDAFCKLWLSENIEFGGWINHTKNWRDKYESSFDKGRLLWMSYEELVGRPTESIQAIADFMGVDTSIDPSLLERVADGCKFSNVKRFAESSLEQGERGDMSHLRKGKVGDWRTHFSECLYQEFDVEIRSRLSKDDQTKSLDLTYDIGDGKLWSVKDGCVAPFDTVNGVVRNL